MRRISMMTQEAGIEYALINAGDDPCLLVGRPAVAFLDARGKRVGLELTGRTPFMNPKLSAGRGAAVSLTNGGKAYLLIAKNACVAKDELRIVSARLTLPHSAGKLTGPTSSQSFESCAHRGDPGQLYAVSSFNASRNFVDP